MVYFNIFDIFKYILNSIRYRIIKHAKTFTILLIVFVVAFLFGTQSKGVYYPPPNDIINNKKYMYFQWSTNSYGLVTSNNGFKLGIYNFNGSDYVTAFGFDSSTSDYEYYGNSWHHYETGNNVFLSNQFNLEQFVSRIIFSNFDIYDNNNNLLFSSKPFTQSAYITNTSSSIENWSFDNLEINGGDINYYGGINPITRPKTFYIDFNYNNRDYSKELSSNYFTISNNGKFIINIPKTFFENSLYLISSSNLSLSLKSIDNFSDNNYVETYPLGSYTITINSDIANDINNSNEKDIQNDMYQEQKKTNENLEDLKNQQQATTNSINNLNNSLTDSNVEDNNVNDIADLSNGFDVTDNTGIDQLFQMVYNAFCSNNPEDLVFTIPFTNTQVTINQSNISSKFPEAIKNIVGVFVWGFIGLYVLKDIRTMINKISEGSPEDVGSDVKKEVL